MKILAIANSKGGSGKTTTVFNLGYSLARRGFKTVVVDFDPQSSLTKSFKNLEYPQTQLYIEDLVFMPTRLNPNEALVPVEKNLWLIPATLKLGGLEEILSTKEHVTNLKITLSRIIDVDFVLIDPPGSTDTFMQSALVAADSIMIPIKPTVKDFAVLPDFLACLDKAKVFNPDLDIKSLVFNQVNVVSKTKDVFREFLSDHPLSKKISKTVIRQSQAAAVSDGFGKSVFDYDKKSPIIKDYGQLTEEVISWI